MTKASPYARHRWFIYSSTGLLVILCLAIILAAMLLMRRGYITREGLITGSSMEPILHGPRLRLQCGQCSAIQEFAWDTCKRTRPFRCYQCDSKDMAPELDLDEVTETDKRWVPGERVTIAPLRMIRAMRASENRLHKGVRPSGELESGVRRGDVVVIQDSPDSQKEVKRLVGLPGELIEVNQGDLFIDGNRYCKKLPQALLQSVLIDAWDLVSKPTTTQWLVGREPFRGVLEANAPVDGEGNSATASTVEFNSKKRKFLDNRLDLNAHDSHAIIDVTDMGIAIQPSDTREEWKLEVRLHSQDAEELVQIHHKGSTIEFESGGTVASESHRIAADQPLWLIVAIVDGHLLVGTERDEWFRRPLATEPAGKRQSHSPPVSALTIAELTLTQGKLSVDQLLVFRDIYYRGRDDQPSQEWAAENRIVVLGDNVSSSSDSRERWDNRLEATVIKGVVLPPQNPIESLLRQLKASLY